MLKIIFIRLFIHLSYKYLFSVYDMLGSNQGAQRTATDNQRWPKGNSYVSNFNYKVIRVTKEQHRVPCYVKSLGGGWRGWWRGERMLPGPSTLGLRQGRRSWLREAQEESGQGQEVWEDKIWVVKEPGQERRGEEPRAHCTVIPTWVRT